MTLNICSSTQCDQVLADFSKFYKNELKHAKVNDSKFEKDKDCHDDSYVKEFCVLRYKELSFVIKIILTRSHGQAALERGFNINNSALKTNVSTSVIAKRLVKGHLLADNVKPHAIQITNPMIRALKGVCQIYATYLDNENKKKIQKTKKKLSILPQTSKILIKSWKLTRSPLQWWRTNTKCMELAEKKRYLRFVVKGNGLDQVKEEMKTTGRSCTWSKEKEVAWKIDTKSCLFIFLCCSVFNLVLF